MCLGIEWPFDIARRDSIVFLSLGVVREKLKDFPDNLTKFPILLEVPRTTTEGLAGQNMSFQLSRAVQLLERTAAKSRQEVCQVAGWHLVSHSFHGSACAGMSWHQARHATRRFGTKLT